MEKLFLDELTFEKEAQKMLYMDKDYTKWVKQIITEFLTNYPMFQEMPLSVRWTKLDTQKGYAIGNLSIAQQANIPIIIQQGQAYPFDIVIINGGTYPLNQWTINELLTSKTPFKDVATGTPKGSLSIFGEGQSLQFAPNNTITPDTSTSETRDAVKVSSCLDNISGTDKESLYETIKELQNATVYNNFKLNSNEDVLNKLAEFKINNASAAIDSFLRNIEIDRQYIFEDELGNKFVKQANSKIDWTWTTEVNDLDSKSLKILASEELGMTKLSSFDKKSTFITETVPSVGDYGFFEFDNKKIGPMEITSISNPLPNVKYASYNLPNNEILVIDNNGNYFTTFDKLANNIKNIELNSVEPHINDIGVFVTDKDSTKIVEIIGMQKNASSSVESWEITTFDGWNKHYYCPLKKHGSFETFGNKTYVPGNAKFIKLNTNLEKTSEFISETKDMMKLGSYGKHFVKISGNNLSTNYNLYITNTESISKISDKENNYYVPVEIEFKKFAKELSENIIPIDTHFMGKDSSGLYYFAGKEFEKYGTEHSIRNLNKNEALWTLLHCGGTKEDLQKLASCKKGKREIVKGKIKKPESVKNLAKTAESFFNNENIKLRKKLVKEASVITDKATVDAVLSLGLINKNNILEFVELIPNYQNAIAELSKLLLFSRIGLNQIPQDPIINAMNSMTEVITALYQLKSIIKL